MPTLPVKVLSSASIDPLTYGTNMGLLAMAKGFGILHPSTACGKQRVQVEDWILWRDI